MEHRDEHDEYAEASAQRDLAEDAGIAEQGIEITRRDGVVVIRGEVESEERRQLIEKKVAAHFPNCTMHNHIVLARMSRPGDAEVLT